MEASVPPSDRRMADRWHMHTEFMLNYVSVGDLKRMIEDIEEGVNFKVNDEGNIVEADNSPIDRNKDELNSRIVRKVEQAPKPVEVLEKKLSRVRQEATLPGMEDDRKAKIEILEEVLEEVTPEYER